MLELASPHCFHEDDVLIFFEGAELLVLCAIHTRGFLDEDVAFTSQGYAHILVMEGMRVGDVDDVEIAVLEHFLP